MTVGIVGLGLIGGSFAKAYKANGAIVLAKETDKSILEFALMSGAVDKELTEANIKDCELLLIALYPRAAIEFLKETGPIINKDTIVIDCCGTKKQVCEIGFEVAKQYGFTFVGGHPMAGIEQSGFKYSKASLFKGAAMIIVPPSYDDIRFYDKIKSLLAPANFGRLTVTTAEKHDKMIAFTSQMAHLVSNAFIKNPIAREHQGYSAGSYKDLTRVAWLNQQMWAELFLENRDNLLEELDLFIADLNKYRQALVDDDFEDLQELLLEGKLIKEEVDRQ